MVRRRYGYNPRPSYYTIATFASRSDPRKTYTVKINEYGELSCDCRGWTVKRGGQARNCRHIKAVKLAELVNPNRTWHQGRVRELRRLKQYDPTGELLEGAMEEERIALGTYRNPSPEYSNSKTGRTIVLLLLVGVGLFFYMRRNKALQRKLKSRIGAIYGQGEFVKA